MKDTDGLAMSSATSKSPRGRRMDESRLHGSGVGPSAGTSWASMASTSHDNDMAGMSPPSSPLLLDCSVQTDEELLKYLLPGLRRRRASSSRKDATSPGGSTSNKSPSSSEDSHLGGVNGKSVRSSGTGGLRGRLSSVSSRGSYHNKEGATSFDTSAVHHVSVTEFEIMDEMDSLLENEHKADTLDATPRRRVGEQSPLLGGEHSPLLTHSTDEKFTSCYSTSEETLSDRHAEPFDDLDDLLTGVEPHQGSFGSLTGAAIDQTPPPTTQQQVHRRQQQLQQQLLHQQQQQQQQLRQQRPGQIDKDLTSQHLVDIKSALQRRYPSAESGGSYTGDTGSTSDRLSAFSSRETCLSDTSEEGVGTSAPSANQMRPMSSNNNSSNAHKLADSTDVTNIKKSKGASPTSGGGAMRHTSIDTKSTDQSVRGGLSTAGRSKSEQLPTAPPAPTSLLAPQAATGYIPHIQVEYATPCPSDSSSPSDLSIDSSRRPSIDSRQDMSHGRRPSAESSGKASSFTSLEELSLNGSGAPSLVAPASTTAVTQGSLQGPAPSAQSAASATAPSNVSQRQARRDNDSVQEFEEYLRRTRGLDLDLSTVQSSDV